MVTTTDNTTDFCNHNQHYNAEYDIIEITDNMYAAYPEQSLPFLVLICGSYNDAVS
jgi:hypothetical protein